MLKINQNGDFLFWHFPPIFVQLKLNWKHCLNANIKFSKTHQNHSVWKSPKMLHLNIRFLKCTNFCLIKIDQSDNTVWPQDFQKLAKMNHFWHFWLTFVHSNVNVTRFACNVEWDLFRDFQTPWIKFMLTFYRSTGPNWTEWPHIRPPRSSEAEIVLGVIEVI